MVTVLLLSYLITAYCVQSAPSNKQWQPTNCKGHWAEAVSYHLENALYPITIYRVFFIHLLLLLLQKVLVLYWEFSVLYVFFILIDDTQY